MLKLARDLLLVDHVSLKKNGVTYCCYKEVFHVLFLARIEFLG